MGSSYVVNVNSSQMYKAKLRLLNCFLKLTDKELDIVSIILNDGEYKLTRAYRRVLMTRLKTSNYNFNNYVQRLKGKGILVEKDGVVSVNDRLIDTLNKDSLTFKFNVTDV